MKKTIIAILTFTAITIAAAHPVRAQLSGSSTPSNAEQRALFRRGARLWPMYCSQCHQARPGSEYSPPHWDVVMAHMRARANLTGEQTRAIVQFLKARQ